MDGLVYEKEKTWMAFVLCLLFRITITCRVCDAVLGSWYWQVAA
jgi:hypothetical protein